MADIRDLNHKPPSSFEAEDDSGLELSLGLSFGRNINKSKGKDSVKELNPDEGKKKDKNIKICLDSAPFKNFHQQSIGEEDYGKQQVGSMPQQHENFWTSLETTTSKEPEKSMRMHMNEVQFPGFGEVHCVAKTSELLNACQQQVLSNAEKNSYAESPGASVNKSNTDAMPKDIQYSTHLAARGQFTQQNLPAHFLDTFRNGSTIAGPAIIQSCANTTSLMHNSFQLVGTQSHSLGLKPSIQLDTSQGKQYIGMENVNLDQQQRQPVVQQDWQDGISEQQKQREMATQKWQEARKKRKQLIEEQKQQKKAKSEDERAGPHGFRRPGSSTWARGLELPTSSVADMEMSKTTQDIHDEGSQGPEMACMFRQGRDKNGNNNELDVDEESSSESQQEQSDVSDNVQFPSVKVDEIGRYLSGAKEGVRLKNNNKDPAESGQYMAARMNGLLKSEEKLQDYRTSTLVGFGKPPVHCTTIGNNSNPALANPPTTAPITMTSTALPYSMPPFPVMPAPYSLPTPVPSHPNVPFPVGYPFFCLMQYPPPAVDGSSCTAARPPIYPNGFQVPLGYTPFPMPTLEASPSWVPVLRPQQSLSFSTANFGGARTSSEPIEDEAKISQEGSTKQSGLKQTGVKSYDKQKSQVSLSTDNSYKQTNSSITRLIFSHNIQDQCAGPDLQVLSMLSTGPVKGCEGPNATGPATYKILERDSVDSPGKDEKKLETRDLDNSNVHGTGISLQTSQEDISRHVIVGPNMTNSPLQEVWNLKPGIACGMSFGGSGTTPDLPWVSTTGVGPNGRTICGVMYKYDANQVGIVCACHGRHMLPGEFVLHAGKTDASSPEKNIVVSPYISGSEAASAKG
ncbi:hypothetical protein SUGI_0008710 [Cryptomeria japonica]|nr:hypothetical protein SUGI_0008710 [Cryptomeria japonica]